MDNRALGPFLRWRMRRQKKADLRARPFRYAAQRRGGAGESESGGGTVVTTAGAGPAPAGRPARGQRGAGAFLVAERAPSARPEEFRGQCHKGGGPHRPPGAGPRDAGTPLPASSDGATGRLLRGAPEGSGTAPSPRAGVPRPLLPAGPPAMPRLEAAANVVLRVPALALLDLLYRWDAAAVAELLRPRHGDGISGDALLRSRALRGASCVGEGERGRRAWREWGRPGVWGGTGAKGRNALGGWERPGCARAVPAMGAPRADMGTAQG